MIFKYLISAEWSLTWFELRSASASVLPVHAGFAFPGEQPQEMHRGLSANNCGRAAR